MAASAKKTGLLGWVLRSIVVLLVLLIAGVLVLWWMARPPAPDAFYEPASGATIAPGALLRAESLDTGTPSGARAWRILYATTRADGTAAVASAVVMAPAGADRDYPVVAWAHGTSGIVSGCAPSLFANPFLNVPAVRDLVASGWAYVATDYVGLGTDGGHAYLIGDDAARAVLDSVRAARQLSDVRLDGRTVVWGHSQGGNSALWTGMIAPTYAPDIPLSGVAALAPASDLPALMQASQSGMFGKIVSSYVVHAYSEAYPDSDALSYVSPSARWLVDDIAGRCVGGRETLVSAVETALLPRAGIFARAPTEGPLGARLAQNSPRELIASPLLIAQGEADDLVLPSIQSRFVAERCAAGQMLDYRTYAGRDHISVLAADSPLTADLVRWTRARFSSETATSTCSPTEEPPP